MNETKSLNHDALPHCCLLKPSNPPWLPQSGSLTAVCVFRLPLLRRLRLPTATALPAGGLPSRSAAEPTSLTRQSPTRLSSVGRRSLVSHSLLCPASAKDQG